MSDSGLDACRSPWEASLSSMVLFPSTTPIWLSVALGVSGRFGPELCYVRVRDASGFSMTPAWLKIPTHFWGDHRTSDNFLLLTNLHYVQNGCLHGRRSMCPPAFSFPIVFQTLSSLIDFLFPNMVCPSGLSVLTIPILLGFCRKSDCHS